MLNYLFSLAEKRKTSFTDPEQYNRSLMFDVYTIVLFFILLCNALLNVVFLKQYLAACFFLVLSVLILSTLLWSNKIRFNKFITTAFFFILGIIVFCCDAVSGKGCMNYLSYISLTIAMAFIFDVSRDKNVMIFLVLSYICGFAINVITEYSLFAKIWSPLSAEKQSYVRGYKVFEIIFSTLVGFCIILRDKKRLKDYLHEKEKLNLMLEKTERINSSNSEELYDLAMQKNPLFITYFKNAFPDFFEKILSVSPTMISSELEICAMLKLNLSTKEIAIATNSTVSAVKNKKYRIRKKLMLNSESDLSVFIIKEF